MRTKPKSPSIPPREVLRTLTGVPGVGKSIAQDLWDLGIRDVNALSNRNAEQLYDRLCTLRGMRVDRCVLYVFRCAVYYANTPQHDPRLLLWWNWKDSTNPRHRRRSSRK